MGVPRSGNSSLYCWDTVSSFKRKRLYNNGSVPLENLAVGDAQVCTTVGCWRTNDTFQLPSGSDEFASISSRYGFSCGILRIGSLVKCWGDMDIASQIENEFGNMSMLSIVAGGSHVCGLNSTGFLVCRGSNSFGQVNVPQGGLLSLVGWHWELSMVVQLEDEDAEIYPVMEKTFFLLTFVLSFHHFMASPDISNINVTIDQSTLMAFKSYITLDPQDMLAKNWSTSDSVCNWFGVTCDTKYGRVTGLNLTNMNLNGTLPPHLGNLTFLVELDLHNNSFHGIVPKELALIPRLKVFNLCTNNFGGEFPTWMWELSKLQHLSLCNNSFSGLVPASLSNLSELETLDLSFNFLHGSIPPELGRLHNLTFLELANNHLSSDIPSSIFNISTLQVIDFSYNFLSGSIPQKVGDLSQLRSINLSKNNLSGSIPIYLFNISTLQEIQFTYNNLSGSLPSYMCRGLPLLENLDLSGNSFSGQIPQSLDQCKELKYLKMINNRFYGHLPSDIGRLSMLEELDLSDNNLTGSLPPSLFNISSLRLINLRNNIFGGQLPEEICTIPYEIGDLKNLQQLHLQNNRLRGSIPPNIFNLSGLQSLSLSYNQLSGNLPNVYHSLSNLQFLYLANNNLSGEIPSALYNASMLHELVLANNSFTGVIPDSIGNLRNLQLLSLVGNKFTSDPSSPEISFLTSLTKCRQLKRIWLSLNPLNGTLPNSIGNLSSSLQIFNAWSCNIKGEIPSEIGNLKNLFDVVLNDNQLIGQVPSTIGTLPLLQRLDLSDNNLNGSIPGQICQLLKLNELSLSKNKFSGAVPGCMGNLTSLRNLYLDSNNLNFTIPSSLWSLTDILEVNFSSNGFSGSLPTEINGMSSVIKLDISKNHLSGNIPIEIGGLQRILNLSLANNMLQGPIPDSVGNMLSLEFLDFSHNLLSGIIPKSMENLLYLKFINLSYNKLQGEIPSGGRFANFTAQSFMMNDALCGRPELEVQPCPRSSGAKHSRTSKKIILKVIVPIIVSGVFVGCAIFLIHRRKSSKGLTVIDLPTFQFPSRISYYELVEATQQFDESNVLGKGGFSSVYRGELSNGVVIAVKVFNLEVQQASRSFDVECEAMRNLRHRNLVKVITSCSNAFDFKALVMEFVPNGSLEKWLYSHNYFLPFVQRLDIVIDVASALEYLHHGNSKPVVHCDLKPSNVLLDKNMVAHVCDFGIAKLLEEGQSQIHTNTFATPGYIAPEYGTKGVVSIKGDAYSYGVMLMEVFTRKKPTDEMFVEGLSLRSWIHESMPRGIIQVVDPNLLEGEEQLVSAKKVALLNIMELALNCSVESPDERMSMEEVFSRMNKIKTIFLQMVEENLS
ncbi:receptor kinase-like protein Xa21 [Gastrolobium bilobum]|uniref:receptor kinase-like protein Xa21 n=1 Tax=Gastrolobium bilobum TaxID=150636 RepID=UPI002AB0A11A|nr:receptor kinase-like protein Xa21 [Gastrolobium bilobum]